MDLSLWTDLTYGSAMGSISKYLGQEQMMGTGDSNVIFFLSPYTGQKMVVNLEQQGFELHGPIYTWILKNGCVQYCKHNLSFL